jgi:hypothetical protein
VTIDDDFNALYSEVSSLRAELEEANKERDKWHGCANRRLDANNALSRELEEAREATDDLLRFVLRPDYDWVEDWKETREYAARTRAALSPNPEGEPK